MLREEIPEQHERRKISIVALHRAGVKAWWFRLQRFNPQAAQIPERRSHEFDG